MEANTHTHTVWTKGAAAPTTKSRQPMDKGDRYAHAACEPAPPPATGDDGGKPRTARPRVGLDAHRHDGVDGIVESGAARWLTFVACVMQNLHRIMTAP